MSGALKYTGVLLCAAYAVWQRQSALLIAAMLFTIAADAFLLFTDRFAAGVAVFIGAQICHALRFLPDARRQTASAVVCAAACAIASVALLPNLRQNAAIPFAALYAFCLVLAAFRAGQWFHRAPDDPAARRALFGMLLFIGCDICVALHNADLVSSGAAAWPSALRQGIGAAIWCFYLPSQFLLVRSASSACLRRRS